MDDVEGEPGARAHARLLRIDCEHCGQSIEIPRTLIGGLTNCPACQELVKVRGSTEVRFFTLLTLGIAAIIGGTYYSYSAFGLESAGSVFAFGCTILLLVLRMLRS